MSRSIRKQLSEAFERSGLTWGELLRLSKVDCSEDSLARKLRGQQSFRVEEAEAVAVALRLEVTFGRARPVIESQVEA